MSSAPSLRPLYNFTGWVIKNIKLSSDVAVIKIRHDKRHLHKCPFCGQKMGENRRLWQVAKDLPLGTAHLVEIIYGAIQGYCNRGRCQFIQYIFQCNHILSRSLGGMDRISFFHFRSDDRANMTSAMSAMFAMVAEPCREISERRRLRLAINRLRDA